MQQRADHGAGHAVAAVHDQLQPSRRGGAHDLGVDEAQHGRLKRLVQVDLLERAARARAAAGPVGVIRDARFDRAADVLDARVPRQRQRALAHQLGAGVGLGIVRCRAHQPAVQRSRADEEVEHLAADHASVEHVRALVEQALAVAGAELGGAQAHVAPEPHAQV